MTAASNSSNKRIALNTVYLYIRMGILMLVKLYTSRVLLQTLGVDNYGAWIAVASFIEFIDICLCCNSVSLDTRILGVVVHK